MLPRMVSRTTMCDEIRLAVDIFNLDRDDIRQIIRHGFKRSFMPGSYPDKKVKFKNIIIIVYQLLFGQGLPTTFRLISVRYNNVRIIYFCYNSMSIIYLSKIAQRQWLTMSNFKKNWYPRNQLTEIYQHRAELQKLWKNGAP